VAEGAADRSYGVHVARLAGLPEAVLARAEEVLHRLERGETRSTADLADDLPLFAAAAGRARPRPAAAAAPPPLETALREVRPDELTPRDALELIYRLKSLLDTEIPRDDGKAGQ
jgi:DNA mismatch repair protein MutS